MRNNSEEGTGNAEMSLRKQRRVLAVQLNNIYTFKA